MQTSMVLNNSTASICSSTKSTQFKTCTTQRLLNIRLNIFNLSVSINNTLSLAQQDGRNLTLLLLKKNTEHLKNTFAAHLKNERIYDIFYEDFVLRYMQFFCTHSSELTNLTCHKYLRLFSYIRMFFIHTILH